MAGEIYLKWRTKMTICCGALIDNLFRKIQTGRAIDEVAKSCPLKMSKIAAASAAFSDLKPS